MPGHGLAQGRGLFQKHCQCPSQEIFCCHDGWKVTLVGSRFTHAAESRYAPIEGEALVVADALDKARHFVLGCSNLVVAVDHKPLCKLFGDRSLEDIPNTRLRRRRCVTGSPWSTSQASATRPATPSLATPLAPRTQRKCHSKTTSQHPQPTAHAAAPKSHHRS